ncbi:oxidoreductase, partial [Halomonas sp. ND22Bw]
MLTVRGEITRTNGEGEARFHSAMLEALPTRIIEKHTPWHEASPRYEAPHGEAIFEAV